MASSIKKINAGEITDFVKYYEDVLARQYVVNDLNEFAKETRNGNAKTKPAEEVFAGIGIKYGVKF